jgi:hypothetical protein
VSVVNETAANATPSPRQLMSKNLQDCTMNFLGHRITTLTADTTSSRSSASEAMKGLALRLLENAAVVHRNMGFVHAAGHRENPRAAAAARGH